MQHRLRYLAIVFALLAAVPAHAQISAFTHIVVIVQENRTPDNLFRELCQVATCNPQDNQTYDILTSNWSTINGNTVNPVPVDLAIPWDIQHHHDPDWVNMCDQSGTSCLMDGAVNETCEPNGTTGCTANNNQPEFTYVQRYNGTKDVLGPYITLASTYGWANLMFQTNEGPSFPAHQFIYGGTSAPTGPDDGNGIYAAENDGGADSGNCLAPEGSTVQLIEQGIEGENDTTYPCFQHETLGTLLSGVLPPGQPITWRYYTVSSETDFWTAPAAIFSECGGSNAGGKTLTSCPGSEFTNHDPDVFTEPKQVLTDIQNCRLRNVSWVIPKGQYSDHAGEDTDKGPSWVASIVNSIGNSTCTDNGPTYWQDTAIIITWDDWGGWYDHEAPALNTTLGYQLGFRVPMLFVSGYGPNNAGGQCLPYIDGTNRLDFGTIQNFIEGNFFGGWAPSNEGKLGFADARALERGINLDMTEDLSNFFNLNQQACTFVTIAPTLENADYFINDTSEPLPPDDE